MYFRTWASCTLNINVTGVLFGIKTKLLIINNFYEVIISDDVFSKGKDNNFSDNF